MIIIVNEPAATSDLATIGQAMGPTRTVVWEKIVSTEIRETGDKKVVFGETVTGERIPLFSVGGEGGYLDKIEEIERKAVEMDTFLLDLRTKVDPTK